MKSFASMGETLEATGTRVANHDVLKLHLNEHTRRLGVSCPGIALCRGIFLFFLRRVGVSPVLFAFVYYHKFIQIVRASNKQLSRLENAFCLRGISARISTANESSQRAKFARKLLSIRFFLFFFFSLRSSIKIETILSKMRRRTVDE